MAAERSPADIQREIEQARIALASSLDQLAERTSPKRLAASTKDNLIAKATSPQGRKVIALSAAGVVALIALSRWRARSK